MKKKLSIVLAVVLVLTLLLTSGAFAGGGKNKVAPTRMVLDASLSEVSIAFDIPKANLEVARSREFIFGADKFLLSSIVDKESKQAYMVSTDAQGKVWIAEPKIEGELIGHMSQMKPEETVLVSIWAIYVSPEEELRQIPSKYPDVTFEGYRPALEADVSPEILDAIDADATEIKLRANEEAVQPVVALLQSIESTILYVSKLAPIVCAELSKEDVYKLARLPEVESISWPNEELEPGLDTAAPTINADYVWAMGYDGGQTQVAVVDTGIDFNHPALQHADLDTIPGGVAGTHGTLVAGCVASNNETNRGIAFGTQLLDADYGPGFLDDVIAACDWAHINYNADLYNFSSGWQTMGQWDNDYCRYFDHIAFAWDRLPVTVAHNDGITNGWVRSPGNAWNVLTVGGIDDIDTPDWGDDVIADFSNWRNPDTTYDDREKPEVCAPAVDIMTTVLGGDDFTEASGTSFAAPQVTGIAALLIEKRPSLRYQPALLKAIIMASAIHNVEPDDDYEQWGYGWPYVEQYRPMDDREGVGTVDAEAAYRCVKSGCIRTYSKFEDNLPFTIRFSASKGQKVRFVITWYAHTDFDGQDYYYDGRGLCADLTLEIVGGPWYPWWSTWYGGSNSRDSAWEIVQFTAPYTGNYYARISAYGSGGDDPWTFNGPEDIAAAWYCWNP